MAATNNNVNIGGLGRKLVLDGLIDEATAEKAFQDALKDKKPFINYLIENKLADGLGVALAASQEFGVPLVDIDSIDMDSDIAKLVDEKLIRQHHLLPIFKRGNRIFIAVSDPTNLTALDEIKFHTGNHTEMILVEDHKLVKAIDKMMEALDTSLDMDGDDFDELDDLELGDTEPAEDDDVDVDDAPVVRFVNKMLLDAIKKGASDLHFEPYEKYYRVRYRIDGVLQETSKPPLALSNKIAARIKVMSRMDVSERRVPQDGRIKLKLSKKKSIDFRVSTCPTLFGEKTVMRILDSDAANLSIDVLGYEDAQKEAFLTNLHKPYGMFLVTGPTGSGKTVSLYTGINILNTVDINISTAEDPVEINLPGVNQVQIEERTGMTFPKALKAFLRQDPDIILVGEIRDLSTAEIAVKAAQTGHMVMSTLHTNDAPQTLTRMQDMGIAPFAIATSINLITGQRLARRLCSSCREPLDLPEEGLRSEGFSEEQIKKGVKSYKKVGCDSCTGGYKGRAGIYQVMPVSDTTKRLIIEGANAVVLADQAAKEGIWDIRRSGLQKVFDGVTSLEEINRVTVE